MRDIITTTSGSTFEMRAVTVDSNDPTLTPALAVNLQKGLMEPWTEWRILYTRNGATKVHLVLNTEAKADAAMDNIRAQEDARRALEAEDGA